MRNTIAVFLLLLFHCQIFFGQLRINEFSTKKGYTDEYGENVDWIEITNIGSSIESLNNYYLTDNENNLGKWHFPETTISPNEKLIVCASGRDLTPFPNHWEAIILAQNTWHYFIGNSEPPNDWKTIGFDDQNWNTGPGGFGYGDNDDNTIIVSNTISIYLRKTFTINDSSEITNLLLHADYDDGFVAYLNGIEIMRSGNFNMNTPNHNTTTTYDHEAVLYSGGIPENNLFTKEEVNSLLIQGDNVLAIQVHNTSNTSSDMSSNFFLSAGIISTNYNYQTLPSWIIPPTKDPHCNFKLSAGEKLVISNQNGNIVDSIAIPNDLSQGLSMGRSPDGTGNWCYFNNPTPGLTNGNSWCYNGVTPAPVINTPSGWYTNLVQVELSTDSQTTVRFTTNGDVPTASDPLYTSAINYNSTTVFSAKAFSNSNLLPSAVVDRTYIVNEQNHNLPVFSIITNEDNLWDWNTGIYVLGPNAGTQYPYFGSNFWEPWSKWSRLEYFDKDQVKHFEAQADLEIHGGWSRAEPQKSFRIDTKSIYTGDIDYPLIPGKAHITEYNNFNLRNGGQHTWSDRIQDGIISRLAKETHNDRMAYQPCIVYLNGDYWGLYGIREKIDEHYVESNHGISSNKVDLLNRDGILVGSNDHFIESYELMQNTNINDSNFFSLLESRFDIENYMDYFIVQTYIQNMDWMGIAWGLNNVKLWRPDTTGGKWRYVIYDTDASFGYFGQNVNDNYLDLARYPSVPNEHSLLFSRALLNSEFKCRFTNRYDDLINTTFQHNNFLAVTNGIKNEMSNAISDHVNLWGSQGGLASYSQWVNAINVIVQYNSSRIATARTHLNQSLSLQGEKSIGLNVSPSNAGKIKISTISPDDYPWSGKYHGGCPIDIIASAKAGYVFSHWDNNSITVTNPSSQGLIGINLNSNYEFVANFITCENAIDVTINENENSLTSEINGNSGEINYEWYANDHLISTDSIIYNPNNGVYQLIIKVDSCEVKSDLLTIEEDDYQIDIYPNPTINEFELVFVITIQQDVEISLYNTLGQEIRKDVLPQFVGQYKNSYDVSQLAKDVYFIKIKTLGGIFTKKIILID